MIEPLHMYTILPDHFDDDVNVSSASYVGHVECKVVEDLIKTNSIDYSPINTVHNNIPSDDN